MFEREVNMPDNKQLTGSPDNRRINIHEAYEVAYWCKELRVTEAQLRAAVVAVGDSAAAVRRYLGK
jgi:hypothetical protein